MENINIENIINNSNVVKELVLEKLLEDNIITESQYDDYNNKYHIIMFKKSWYLRWMNFFSDKEDGWVFKFVRFEK